MDEEQSYPQSQKQPDNSSAGKKIVLIFLITISALAILSTAYILGTKSNSFESANSQISSVTLTLSPTIPSENFRISKTPTPIIKSTPTPRQTLKVKSLPATAILDGFQASNGGGNLNLEIRAGRNSDLVSRGFVSFDLKQIPQNSDITSAKLRLYQVKAIGNPYDQLGSLKLDHLNFGATLEDTDYSTAAISSNFTTISENSKIEWKEVDVTNQVKNDILSKLSHSQFRLHFEKEVVGSTASGDFVYFESGNNSQKTGNTPHLIIKYY